MLKMSLIILKDRLATVLTYIRGYFGVLDLVKIYFRKWLKEREREKTIPRRPWFSARECSTAVPNWKFLREINKSIDLATTWFHVTCVVARSWNHTNTRAYMHNSNNLPSSKSQIEPRSKEQRETPAALQLSRDDKRIYHSLHVVETLTR